MTDQLFSSAPTAPLLAPAERIGRWVLHRGGIHNVWQYDQAEILFAGGRALLRGKNGAGKSKALEVLLPFLLDGDTRALDAAGRDRTTVYWLMTDGRESGNHVGYVWLELRMTTEDGEDRFCTLGAGLKASTSTRQASSWFFVAEDTRVGVDLILNADVSADKLKARLGPDTVTTAAEHRRRVATRLFGLSDESRYGNLIHLLHRLRDPNIGNKIEAGELVAVLRDALPPPLEEAMEKAAERFDTLDEVRNQLDQTQRTAAVLSRFLDTYRRYARTVLRERSAGVLNADRHRRGAERQAAVLAKEAADTTAAREGGEAQVERLRAQERDANRRLDGLRQSDAYKQHLNLVDRHQTVETRGQAAAAARRSAAKLEQLAKQATDDEQREEERAAQADRRVQETRPGLLRWARQAGIDQTVVATDRSGIATARVVADGRRRRAEAVRRLADHAAQQQERAARLDEQASRSEQELTARQAEADAAADIWTAHRTGWQDAVRAWPQLDGLDLDWSPLHQVLGAEDELTAAPSAAAAILGPRQEEAREAEGRARSARTDAARALNEKEKERAALEAATEARPQRSRYRDIERDPGTGAPFYELVDFAPGLGDAERAGLEAALEASGLLDAWVSNDGLVMHPATQDVILRVDAPTLADGFPTLADVLVAERPSVTQLLRTVGLGERRGDDCPWVALDGRWSIGPLRGAWSKTEGEFVGARARRATRERRLAEIARQCAALRLALTEAEGRLGEERRWRETLEGVLATFPNGDAVRAVRSKADALAGVALDARHRHDDDRRAAETGRTDAARARNELAHAAAADNLPVEVDGLDTVVEAARDLVRGLRDWDRLWADLEERQAVLQMAGDRRAERTEDALAAAADAARVQQDYDEEASSLQALEEALEATVEEVLGAIKKQQGLLEEARTNLPRAEKHVSQLARDEGKKSEQARAAAEAVAAAVEAVITAARRLRQSVALPGVTEAAMDAEWAWDDAADAVVSAREVHGQVGDGDDVRDQALLNRVRDLEDGLAGGYDVSIGEDDGVKFFHVTDDTGRQPLAAVAARVAVEADAARGRLAASEREVIERFLLGELGEELRDRLLESHDLVRSANAALDGVQTSHGKGVHLDWRIDGGAPPAALATARLLVMSPRSAEEDRQLRDGLMELIRTHREKDPALGYLEHLRSALDYRKWYLFTVQVTDGARPGSTRALSSRLGLSQGEQRVLSYLALFAAASAHFDGLGAGCPRLLLLDDAFAKVDEPTHGRLLELLVQLDLDFLLTSERMWGCFPAVPSLEIYEALREPTQPGVALVHFRWDGHARHLVGL